jgi:hypothetical protein
MPGVHQLEEQVAAAGDGGQVAGLVGHEQPRPAGTIELVLPSGATIRVIGQVDAALLRAVLAELGGRRCCSRLRARGCTWPAA